MEESLKKKKSHEGVAGAAIKEEKGSESNHEEEEDSKDQDMITTKENELELAKAKMREVREENQRLKMYLDKMMKDYQNLQNQFNNIVHNQQQAQKKSKDTTPDDHYQFHHEPAKEGPEFVSLSLGRSSSSTEQKKDISDQKHQSPRKTEISSNNVDEDKDDQGLALGLDCKFDAHPPKQGIVPESSPENSLEDVKEEDVAEAWPPQKIQKTAGDDDVSEQNPVKKARVSVRVRCDTPTMNDGCQWRKYGQKIAKGNPCPRAYYRCSVAPNCPVRKQVQRCSQDMSILITTYEGKHNHSLPIAAHAMASTTSAAADMLLSGSSTSTSSSTSTAPAQLHGLNYYLSNNTSTSKSPFYIPNTSISSSNSCPSITLDLTTSSSTNFPQRYNVHSSSTNLNFSTSNLESNTTLPISWNYGSNYQLPNYNNMRSSLNFGRQHQENLYNQYSYMQKNNNVAQTQHSLDKNSIETATKAITSDPNFQSALAAALTSIMSSNNTSGGSQNHVKLEQSFPVLSSFLSTNAQASNSRILTTQLPSSKSKSTSPEDNI